MLKKSKETVDLSHVDTDAILKDSDDVEADIRTFAKRLQARAMGKPIFLIVDGVQGEVNAYTEQLCQQIPDITIWTAGAWPSPCPTGFVLKELSTSVRRPPVIQNVLKMTELPPGPGYRYLTRSTEMDDFPLATSGLPVMLLSHAGHGEGSVLQCRECGESLARYLQELRLGKDVEAKDLMILLADSTPLHSDGQSPSQFVQALSDHNIPLDIVDDCTNSQERLAFPSAKITLTNYQYVIGLERKVVIFVPEGTASDNSVIETCTERDDVSVIYSTAGITSSGSGTLLLSKLPTGVSFGRRPTRVTLHKLEVYGENSQEVDRQDSGQKNTQEEHQHNKQEVGQNSARAQENVEKNRQEGRDKSRYQLTQKTREDADTDSVRDVRSEKVQHSTQDRQDIPQNSAREDQQRHCEEAAVIITVTRCHEVADQRLLEEDTSQRLKGPRGNIQEECRHGDAQKNFIRLTSRAGQHSEYESDTEGDSEEDSDSELSFISYIANCSSSYDSDQDEASESEPELSTETQNPLRKTRPLFPPQSDERDTPGVCGKAKTLDHDEEGNDWSANDRCDSCLESELSSSEAVESSSHGLEDVHVQVSDTEEQRDTPSLQACHVDGEEEAPQPRSCPGDVDTSATPPADPPIPGQDLSAASLQEQQAALREGRVSGRGAMRSAESRLQAAVQSLSPANREKLRCSVSRALAHAVVFHF